MSVALELTIGNTRIRIHDDRCRDASEQEIQAALKRASACVGAGEASGKPGASLIRSRSG